MLGKVLNCFEETQIDNKSLPEEWQSQSSLDELADFLQLNWEQRSSFYEDGEVRSRQQFLEFKNHRSIRTNNYIGTIAFKGQQINIYPKVFREDKDDNYVENLSLSHLMKNLIQWLKYCTKVNYPFISINSRIEESEDLRELFITLYLNYIKQALDYGPFYQYVDKNENIQTVKGRIDFKDYINTKMPNGQNHVFLCNYSEFEFDNKVNRIIKYTCNSLINATSSSENKKIIRNILIKLNDVTNVRCTPSDCDGIRLSKMHRRYAVIISMSKMFLLNQTTAYHIDNQESFCFLFPTELLFEGFIGGYINEVLNGQAHVRFQASELTLISNMVYRGKSLGKAFKMKHDILVEHKQLGLFVLDTKYKHLSRFEGNDDVKHSIVDEVTQTDLYQVIEYAAHRDLDKAYLLYPMYRYEEDEPADVVLERESESGKRVSVHIVRLPFIFEEDYEATKTSLKHSIERIFSMN